MMIGDKFSLVIEYCKNRDVLDIGCVEAFNYTTEEMRNSLHYRLKRYTKRLVGVDLEEEGI